MNRREILKSLSVGALGATTTHAAPVKASVIPLFIRDWGTGKPVLFVHGWAFNSDMWQHQMIRITGAGFRAVAYDRRGHGQSPDPGTGYDFDTLAADLASVIDRLDLRDVTLVGHSMGCGEITRYLAKYGSRRVKRVAFVAPSLPFMLRAADNPDGVDGTLLDKVHTALANDYPKWLSDNARPFFRPETSDATIQWALQICMKTSLKAALDCNHSDMRTDFRKDLARIDVPTLIVHGDADVSATLDFTARRTQALVRGSLLKVYEGAPHGLFYTHREKLDQDLLDFIGARPAATTSTL